MLISTQTDVLANRYGEERAIEMIAEAGFDCYDISLFRLGPDKSYIFNTDRADEYTARLKAAAERCNITCNQAHAPFPSSTGVSEEDEVIFGYIVRSMEIASALGAKSIVVHPMQHLEYAAEGNPELLRQANIRFYRSLIPHCERLNIKVATENMWQRKDGKIVHSVCASPEEFRDYVDSIGSPWITACLDIGHVVLVGEDMENMIKTLGAEYFVSVKY